MDARYLLLLPVFLAGCVLSKATPAPPGAAPTRAEGLEELDRVVPDLLREYNVAGAGVAVVRDGAVVWTGYYGEQGPGVPASARTVFNTASVAKTVTAETLLALAAKGLVSLDEPVADYVTDPDLAGDPRYGLLTPRLLLSHRSGLLNWPGDYDDGRLAFVRDPGTAFGYSGAGIELAARYAENRLGRDFEALAVEHVLGPLGVGEMSMGRMRPWLDGRLAVPMDAEGRYHSARELGSVRADSAGVMSGGWNGADDLFTTVDAYARLLVGVIGSEWLTPEQRADRSAILTSLTDDPTWKCEPTPEVRCAEAYGHGLGWMVYDYGDHAVLKHGGNDAGENALVYYSPERRSGAVIFVNGGNGIFVTVGVLDLIGDEPEVAAYYRQLVERHYGVSLPHRP